MTHATPSEIRAARQRVAEAAACRAGEGDDWSIGFAGLTLGDLRLAGMSDRAIVAEGLRDINFSETDAAADMLEADEAEQIDVRASGEEWRPIETAPALDTLTTDLAEIGPPYDGNLYLLLCPTGDPEDDATFHTEDAPYYRTIGYWQEDQGWLMAGWDWCHDTFRDGHGKPIKYALIPAPPSTGPSLETET